MALAQQATLAIGAEAARHLRQERRSARGAQPHRPGDPRRPRAGLHRHPHAARRRRRAHGMRAAHAVAGYSRPHPRPRARWPCRSAPLGSRAEAGRGPGRQVSSSLCGSSPSARRSPGRVTCTFDGGIASAGPARAPARADAHRAGSRDQRRPPCAFEEDPHRADRGIRGLDPDGDRRRPAAWRTCRNFMRSRASASRTCASERKRSADTSTIQSQVGHGTQVIVRLPRPKTQ